MRNQSSKLTVFGHECTSDQLSAGLLIFCGLVGICFFAGLTSIALVLMVGACLGLLVWALRFSELSDSSTERFTQLRRLVTIRRKSESASENKTLSDIPVPVVIIIGCLIVSICTNNLLNARQQYAAKAYPSVMGLMTRYKMVDVGMVSSAMEVEYEYTAFAQKYQGDRFRFLYRPYRVGTEEAKALAAKWGPGKRIPVFYHPQNPANAAIDNTFCKGDQLFVLLNTLGIVSVLLIACSVMSFRILKGSNRQRPVHFDAMVNRTVIELSNMPLYGSLGLILTAIAFGSLVTLLIGGFFAMGDGAIPWMVSAIDWMVVITGGLFSMTLTCCIAECLSYGRQGRTCEVDTNRNLILIHRESFASKLTLDFQQVDSIKVISKREDWLRMNRTFSSTIFYRDHFDSPVSVILERNTNRNQAVHLMMCLQELIESTKPDECVLGRQRAS